jgi:hypothetical protein
MQNLDNSGDLQLFIQSSTSSKIDRIASTTIHKALLGFLVASDDREEGD